MVDKIEMSLDEIIKSSKPQRGAGGRGGVAKNGGGPRPRGGPPRNGGSGGFRQNRTGGGGGGGSGVLKGRQRGGIQRSKYARGDVNSAWKHDMYEGARKSRLLAAAGLGGGGGAGGLGGSTKLMVSNLDFGVSESDINELFADFGPLKSASVHYDRSGRSLGTADVVFERRADAIKAMKQYNGVPLDGRPMSIQLATSDIPVPRAPRLGGSGDRSLPPRSPRSPGRRQGGGDRSTSRGNSQTNQRRGGGGGGPRRQQRETKTAEELDAELDAYTKDMK